MTALATLGIVLFAALVILVVVKREVRRSHRHATAGDADSSFTWWMGIDSGSNGDGCDGGGGDAGGGCDGGGGGGGAAD